MLRCALSVTNCTGRFSLDGPGPSAIRLGWNQRAMRNQGGHVNEHDYDGVIMMMMMMATTMMLWL